VNVVIIGLLVQPSSVTPVTVYVELFVR